MSKVLGDPYDPAARYGGLSRDTERLKKRASGRWHAIQPEGTAIDDDVDNPYAEPAFENGWENVGGDAPPAAFYLSLDGEVRLRGAIQSGTVPSVCFTLPEHFRPHYSARFVGALSVGNDIVTIQVDPDGAVTIVGSGWQPGTGTVSTTVLDVSGGDEGDFLSLVGGVLTFVPLTGSTPGGAVTSETSFGQASSAGSNSTFSRSNHTHGTPTNPVTAHLADSDPHTQYIKETEKAATSGVATLDGTTKVPVAQLGTGSADDSVVLFGDRVWRAVADLGGTGAASTVTSETTFGISSAAGTSMNYAREDHTHGSPTNPVTAHVAAGDPHTGYQLRSEKGSGSGYAGLSSGRVPIAQLASGTPDGTKFIRDDGVLAVPAGGGGGSETPGDVVEDETTFGISPDAGVGSAFSRVDHTHGSPVNPVTAHVAELDPHDQYQLTSGKNEPDGYPELDAITGLVPAGLLGSDVGIVPGSRVLTDANTWIELATEGLAGIAARLDGTLIGTRFAFNFHGTDEVEVDVVDDSGDGEVDITVGLVPGTILPKQIQLEFEDAFPVAAEFSGELVIPQIDGVDFSFDLAKATVRLSSPGVGNTVVVLQSSPGGNSAFSPTALATLTITSGAYQADLTGSYGTVESGEIVRLSWTSVGADAEGYFLLIEGSETP